MNRLALLIPILLFLTFDPKAATAVPGGLLVFFGFLAVLVLVGRFLAWQAAERTLEGAIVHSVSRVIRLLSFARIAALGWTGAGLYLLGWGEWSDYVLEAGHLSNSAIASAALVTLPGYLAWLGLYWAQYPAEHATRGAAMLAQLEAGLPVREGPSLGRYLDHQLRIGPGALLGPMAAVLVLRDAAFFVLHHVRGVLGTGSDGSGGAGGTAGGTVGGLAGDAGKSFDGGVYIGSILAVFVLSPVLLTKILRTHRLPNDELRRRLESLAKRAGVTFRDILLWDTAGSMGNALVAGVVSRFRYVLLSDVLVETMTDEQIEAVFAHELGHIVHRHIAWYAAFLLSGSVLLEWLPGAFHWLEGKTGISLHPELTASLASLIILLAAFGFVSRWSERQADVFAARAIGAAPPPELPPSRPLQAAVGPHGAAVFGSALREVARINHMPSATWGYLHGSIAGRVETLRAMGNGQPTTREFDARMRLLRWALALFVLAATLSVILRAWW